MNTLPILYQRLFFINHILSYFSTRKNTNTGLVNQKFIRGHLFNVFPYPWSVAFQSHPQAEPLQTVHLRLFFSRPPIHLDHLEQHGRGGREKDDGRCNQSAGIAATVSSLCKNCNEDEEVWTLEWAEWILLRWSVLVSGLSQCVASYNFAQRLFALFDRLAFSDSSFEGFHPVSKNLFSHGSNHCRVPACWTVRLLTLWMQNDNEKRRPGEESQDGKESEDDRRCMI